MDTRAETQTGGTDAHVEACVSVNASAEDTWARLVDWESQSEWMIATKVSGAATQGVGDVLSARTGLGPIGFVDAMEVVRGTRLLRAWWSITGASFVGSAPS